MNHKSQPNHHETENNLFLVKKQQTYLLEMNRKILPLNLVAN